MKLFTRLAVPMAVLLLSVASAFAATITVQVGDNFYRGPDGTSTIRMASTDELVFQNIGSSTHPTASAQWTTFIINPTTPTKTFPAGTFAVGTFPFLCTVHSGMVGTIIVTGTATATTDANLTAALSVYPNPSHGQVTVQLNQKAGADYKLRLSNIIGQEVRTVTLRPELTAAGLPLDLSELRAGVYFYSLLVNGKVASTKRLVLQN
ncbi:T9SS type A sorting domain-containing protein [Hymenobacter sp. UYCo722]|uniref:T9SS type A sorting domain-containing protein n=1 Tax=Hymenobacter sp. UYCo722 TaxID=3156335 RepID=UPI00339AED60